MCLNWKEACSKLPSSQDNESDDSSQQLPLVFGLEAQKIIPT